MTYTKKLWLDQNVERPKTYEFSVNPDDSVTLIESFGNVVELGTPVNASNMNHIEEGIAGCAIRKYSASETYEEGEWVLGTVNNKKGIFTSLVNNNLNNPITDSTKWQEVQLGGNTRNIGEIIASTIPLADAGLHLLDGSLLSYGTYADFIDYVADLYDSGDYPDLFETESNWQASVTNYGVCGKFVYDSVNNTVRLPKYNNKIYTGGGIAPVVGNGKTIGFTRNGSDVVTIGSVNESVNGITLGSVGYKTGTGNIPYNANVRLTNAGFALTTQPNQSNIFADLSNITTSLSGYYYIVIGTSTKMEIEVDIDEIATDLNGKADTDLSNVSMSQVFKNGILDLFEYDYQNGINIASSITSTGYTAPSDGLLSFNVIAAGKQTVYVNGEIAAARQTNGTLTATYAFCGCLPVKKDDVLTTTVTSSSYEWYFVPMKGVN